LGFFGRPMVARGLDRHIRWKTLRMTRGVLLKGTLITASGSDGIVSKRQIVRCPLPIRGNFCLCYTKKNKIIIIKKPGHGYIEKYEIRLHKTRSLITSTKKLTTHARTHKICPNEKKATPSTPTTTPPSSVGDHHHLIVLHLPPGILRPAVKPFSLVEWKINP